MLDINQIRSQFPILQEKINGNDLVYFDNAATSQKPLSVINSLTDYYSHYNSNVHRGVHTLSQKATEKYEEARDKVRDFIGAEKREEIIFTKNDTESLNLIAQSWGMANLHEGDEVILSVFEHHSNIVPWQLVAAKTGAKLRFVQMKDGLFDYDHYFSLLSEKTKVVSLSQGSNVTGEIIDFNRIIPAAHERGAIVIADCGQTAAHYLVDVRRGLINQTLTLHEIDFLTFSSHKIYGPTGVGVLYGREHHLEKMEPFLSGGDMIKEVFEEYATWNDLPYKFEAGTPNIADVIALGSAIDFINSLDPQEVINHEKEVTDYAKEELRSVGARHGMPLPIDVYSVGNMHASSLPIVTFNIHGVHSHDVGTILDQHGIAIRTGHHCVQPLMSKLGVAATCRASFAVYNTKDEVDKMIEALLDVKKVFNI